MRKCPEIVSLLPDSLADVWNDIERVARALRAPDHGTELIATLQSRMQAIHERSKSLMRPTVACIEWVDPLMAAGNWMPQLVEMAGGSNVFGTAGKHSPWLSWEQLCSADPDVIVLLPCGFGLERTRQDVPLLAGRPEWSGLKAVRASRVFVTDGNQYFNRPGPRLVESLEILAEMIHPEAFDFGHHGRAWSGV
jgi:iron complex transport system substrate-binding protein